MSTAARCTADGNTSFDDWPMFTWSLGWTPSPARFAITSLAFMFDEVPEPVWKTSIGNWSSCSPLATSSPAARDPLGELRVQQSQLGVHACGRGLDPAQPAHHRRGHVLARDREVLYRFHRLRPPELLLHGLAYLAMEAIGRRSRAVAATAAGERSAFRVLIDRRGVRSFGSNPSSTPVGDGRPTADPLLLALRRARRSAPAPACCGARCELRRG